MWNEIIKQASNDLPEFNDYLLKDYKKEQIDKTIDYMKNCFQEAIKLFDGYVTLKGVRILSPEERIKATYFAIKYALNTTDITQTELSLVEFEFEAWQTLHKTQMYLPYLVDGAIIINGAKYYPMFPLTDSVFYYMMKENGIGIKVLTSHMKFYRNFRYNYTSMSGNRYNDFIIITQIHQKSYKYTADDIKPCILIYSLSKFGWNETLSRYNINPESIDIVSSYDPKDDKHEYFEIRKGNKDVPGLYLKVNAAMISTNPELSIKTQMQVVSHIHYCLQYFVRVENTIFIDNLELVQNMKNSTTVWRVILGKMIYGVNHPQEAQVLEFAKVHLESLDLALDKYTRSKLNEIGLNCQNAYELLDHVFIYIDEYLVNYSPSSLYNKRINILDLLLGNIVRTIFSKIYKKTNNRKNGKIVTDNIRDISNLFRTGMKAINQIHKCSQVVAGNPAMYNDNYLITIGLRKVRATHSSSTGGTKASDSRASGKSTGRQNANLISSPQHRLHESWLVVESLPDINGQNPGVGGSINTFLPIDKRGNILIPNYVDRLEDLKKSLITK